MDDRPIGIFDSGVGGLTVFQQIKTVLPNERMIYLGDTKRFPYGSKSKETIIELSRKNCDFLIKSQVKVIIIACGTATSQALESLKNMYSIPIVGIIEPTVLSLKQEKIHKIGVMATTGTIKSNSWEHEIKKLIPDVDVINKPCPLLAQMAEEGWTNNEIARLTIKEYVSVFKNNPVEKLILGCTHYPLFKDLIEKELGENTEIIDTGNKVGTYLKKFLYNNKMTSENNEVKKDEFYLTDLESNFLKVANNLLNTKLEIKKADI